MWASRQNGRAQENYCAAVTNYEERSRAQPARAIEARIFTTPESTDGHDWPWAIVYIVIYQEGREGERRRKRGRTTPHILSICWPDKKERGGRNDGPILYTTQQQHRARNVGPLSRCI